MLFPALNKGPLVFHSGPSTGGENSVVGDPNLPLGAQNHAVGHASGVAGAAMDTVAARPVLSASLALCSYNGPEISLHTLHQEPLTSLPAAPIANVLGTADQSEDKNQSRGSDGSNSEESFFASSSTPASRIDFMARCKVPPPRGVAEHSTSPEEGALRDEELLRQFDILSDDQIAEAEALHLHPSPASASSSCTLPLEKKKRASHLALSKHKHCITHTPSPPPASPPVCFNQSSNKGLAPAKAISKPWTNVKVGGALEKLLDEGWMTGYVIFAKNEPSPHDPKVTHDYSLIFDPSTGTIYCTGKGFASKVELLEPVLFYEKRDYVWLRQTRWPKAHEPRKMPLDVQEEWALNPAAQVSGKIRGYMEKDKAYRVAFDVEGKRVAQTFIVKAHKVELLLDAPVIFSARKLPNEKGVYAVTLALDPAADLTIYNRQVLSPEVLEDPHFQQSHILLGFGNGAMNQGGVNPFFITEYEAMEQHPLSLELMIQKYHWDIACALRLVLKRLANFEEESFGGIYLIGIFQKLSNRYLELMADGIRIDILCSFATAAYWLEKVEEQLSRKPNDRLYGVLAAHIFLEVPVGTNAANIRQRGVLGFLNADPASATTSAKSGFSRSISRCADTLKRVNPNPLAAKNGLPVSPC